MAASSPERVLHRVTRVRAAVLGVLLAGVLLAGAARTLSSAGLLAGVVGLCGTAGVAFCIGLWAGAPAALEETPPLHGRWLGVGLTVAVAGAVATVLFLFRGLAATLPGRVTEVLLVVAVPCYAIGLVLPPLLAWSERREAELDAPDPGWGVLGDVVLGSLAGLVLGFVVAGVLLARVPAGALLLGASFLPLAALLLRDPEPDADERPLYLGATPFGELRVTEVVYAGERQPERRLYVNGEEESGEQLRSGAPTLAYIAAAERWLAQTAQGGEAYLFLGGGAYTLPRRIAERDPRARITVVELDPEVTRLALHFFGLRPEHAIRTAYGDARAYLDAAPTGAFDRIYSDVYAGHEALPYSLVTREAFRQMSRLLRPGGSAAVNLIGCAQGPEALRLWSVVRTFAEVFPGVALYAHLGPDFPERQNFLLAGTLDAGVRFPERIGIFEGWPRDAWPPGAGTVVYRDLAGPDP